MTVTDDGLPIPAWPLTELSDRHDEWDRAEAVAAYLLLYLPFEDVTRIAHKGFEQRDANLLSDVSWGHKMRTFETGAVQQCLRVYVDHYHFEAITLLRDFKQKTRGRISELLRIDLPDGG